jgi:hypothetical protein
MTISQYKYGAVNGAKGLYNVPNDGLQFTNACDVIWNLGMRSVKLYCTADYVTDYPLQTSWSSTPTSLTELAQTTQFTSQLTRAWNTVTLTCFTFANGSTNWWIVNPSRAKLDAEYTEIKNLAIHLLTTYNDTGKSFVIQNWEGDWAFGDSFDPTVFIPRTYVDNYCAFLGTRQRAVEDALRETAHVNVSVQNAIECNRILDSISYENRRRIVRDIASRVQPHIASYSAYDSTIATYFYLANFAAWQANCEQYFAQSLRVIRAAFPNSVIQIGEFGFPENEMLLSNGGCGYDPGDMIEVVRNVAAANGVSIFFFWQSFDNEFSALPEGVRGYWCVDQAGVTTPSGQKMADFAAGL